MKPETGLKGVGTCCDIFSNRLLILTVNFGPLGRTRLKLILQLQVSQDSLGVCVMLKCGVCGVLPGLSYFQYIANAANTNLCVKTLCMYVFLL